ncbi:MAG: dephospho-CoA kinase [Thermoflexales bacterium]|nr:dephospho-CoA kinase [Thermoflexales bacterium]
MPRLLIGLTGNIATGKSAVAHMLRELGAVVIDADRIARDVVRPGQPTLDAIVRAFGPEVLLPNGELDRPKMARLVFSDPDKLKQLEAIVHPAVREAMQREIQAQPDDAVVVIEVIKLFESGWARLCDQVWVTHCPPQMQVERLVKYRGLSPEEARARVEAQNPQAEKLSRADVIIDTSGSLEETRRQVVAAWQAANC